MTEKLTISKEFLFEMAHALDKYNGLCRYIHGHTYKLIVTVQRTGGADENGFVIDFTELKRIVTSTIISRYDHALMLKADGEYAKLIGKPLKSSVLVSRTKFVQFNPTVENMVKYFMALLSEKLEVVEITLYETPTSYATLKGEIA